MTPVLLDMSLYPRRAHFDYFRAMANPYAGATVRVDVTALYTAVKAARASFFGAFLHAASRAANDVPELRMRTRGDGIALYDECESSYTVALDDGTYCYCRLSTAMPVEEFLPAQRARQEAAKRAPSLDDGASPEGLLFISCIPWLDYEAVTQPTPSPADSNPRVTWGKYRRDGDIVTMPVTLVVNHALADGRHIAAFYERLAAHIAEDAARIAAHA